MYWIAKSTMDVVPPYAAAIVPDSKSSADVVPPNGMSRCVCTSMPPGITSLPAASRTGASIAGAWPCAKIAAILLAFDEDVSGIVVDGRDDAAALDEKTTHVRA